MPLVWYEGAAEAAQRLGGIGSGYASGTALMNYNKPLHDGRRATGVEWRCIRNYLGGSCLRSDMAIMAAKNLACH
jgi:hypothetical protein